WAVRRRTLAYSDCLVFPGLGRPEQAFARASLALLLAWRAFLQTSPHQAKVSVATAARSSASCSEAAGASSLATALGPLAWVFPSSQDSLALSGSASPARLTT